VVSPVFLLDIGFFAGDCNSIPANANEFPLYLTFPDYEEHRLASGSLDMANLPDCGCVSLVATVAYYNPRTSGLDTFQTSLGTDYCNCDEPEEPDDKNLRTQTPGGWGAPPRGNNPGVYLHANFDAAFPGGLVVGCDHTISLTSAQAVTDYLPTGGTPAALTMNYVNPTNSPKNTLAGHVIALTLSTTFDGFDPYFGESNTNLIDAVVTQGTFSGWTVAQVLAEANKVLGGCASPYSPSQMTDVVSKINECFVDGTTNTGFLMNGN